MASVLAAVVHFDIANAHHVRAVIVPNVTRLKFDFKNAAASTQVDCRCTLICAEACTDLRNATTSS